MTNRHPPQRRLFVEALEPRRLLTSLPFEGHGLTATATCCDCASMEEYTQVFGRSGDLWNPADETLLDFSYAGYHEGLHDYPEWEIGANVRDFGAVGDGVADDTQAFLDARAACPDDHVVYVPNGTYKLMDWLGVDEMIGTWVKPDPKSRFAFRGEDRDQTVILLGVGLQDIHPWDRTTGTGRPTTQWSWHGGFLWFQDSEEVGVENLTIKGSGTQYEGHWDERGYNGIFFKNVDDAWVREVTLINVDSGIIANNSRHITVEDVLYESTPGWPSTDPLENNFGMSGHHGISFMVNSSWCLADNVVFTNQFHHEQTLGSGATHCVFSDVVGPNLHFDFHTQEDNLPNNLFTEIDAGDGSLIWRNNFYGACTGSVLWNIKGENLSLPVEIPWVTHPVLVEDLETLLVGWPIDLPDLQVVGRPWFEDITPENIQPQNIYHAQRNLRLGQPPTVDSYTPPDDLTGVALNTNLVIDLSQNMQKGTGNIVIKKSSDDSTVETIPVTSAQVTVAGDVVTIDPSSDLAYSTGYYVQVDSGAIEDTGGNDWSGISDKTTWNFTALTQATVVDGHRYIFYDDSYWDGNTAGPNTTGGPGANGDDGAIATDKSALLPGGAATSANWTSYSKGINGIMVDVAALANPTAVGDNDFSEFAFRVGNDSNPSGPGWTTAAAPTDVDVRDLGGGVRRVSFFWAAGAIPTRNWLQLTLKADATTGLGQDDVFYFGNAIGDANLDRKTLYDDIFAIYTCVDFVNFKPITEPCDVNRDGQVLYDDIFACYSDIDFTSQLALITPPVPPSAPRAALDAPLTGEMLWAAHLAALDDLDRSSEDSEEDDRETAADALFAAYGGE